jgi:uncharacterized cupin superfamily protein
VASFANEEMLLVVRGRPHMRGPVGWRKLHEGEVVAFPLGERGAHNRSGLRQNFYSRESVDYWDGEQPPEVPS